MIVLLHVLFDDTDQIGYRAKSGDATTILTWRGGHERSLRPCSARRRWWGWNDMWNRGCLSSQAFTLGLPQVQTRSFIDFVSLARRRLWTIGKGATGWGNL